MSLLGTIALEALSAITTMKNQRSWLEIVEYVSIAGAIAGSVVAVVSKEIIYAATPMSLSLVLNLIERQRWEHLNRQNTPHDISQVEQHLSSNVESIRQEILALPSQSDLGGMQEALERVGAGIAEIKSEMAEQTRDLGSFQANLQNLSDRPVPDLTAVQAQIERLAARIEEKMPSLASSSMTRDISSLQGQIEELKQILARLSERISQLQQSFQTIAPRQDLSAIASEIEKLQLQQKLLEQSMAPIAPELAKLYEKIVEIRLKFNALSDDFNGQPVENLQASSAQQMEELKEALARIQQRLDESPSSPEISDLKGIETALANLSGEIAAVQEQMQNRLASIEKFDLNPLRADMAALQTQCANLQESLDRLARSAIPSEIAPSQPVSNQAVTPAIIQPFLEEKPASKSAETKLSSTDRYPSLWRCVHTLRGHSNAVTCLCISPNGKILASGSYQEIKLWNLETGEEIQTLTVRSEAMAVCSISISPNGEILACANGNVEIWHLGSGEMIRTLETSCWASSVAISPDGKLLVSVGEDPVDETGSIQIWNLLTGELLHEFEQAIYSVAIAPNGQIMACGAVEVDELDELDETGLIQLRHLETGELLYAFTEHSGKVYSVAISSDGKILASGSQDRTIKLWNIAQIDGTPAPDRGRDVRTTTPILLRTLQGHTLSVHSVAMSADGQTIASGSGDKTVKVWNLQTGELLQTLSEHSEKISVVAFSPKENILASGSHDETLKIWRRD